MCSVNSFGPNYMPLRDALKTKKVFDLTGLSRILCFGVCNIPQHLGRRKNHTMLQVHWCLQLKGPRCMMSDGELRPAQAAYRRYQRTLTFAQESRDPSAGPIRWTDLPVTAMGRPGWRAEMIRMWPLAGFWGGGGGHCKIM